MNGRKLIFYGLILWILLTVICLLVHARNIENKLTIRTTELLQKTNVGGISVSFSGRDAILSGKVTSETASERIENLVRKMSGVRGVQNELVVEAPVVNIPDARGISESQMRGEAKKVDDSEINIDQLLSGLQVEFESNSYQLNMHAMPIINQVQSILKQHRRSQISIQGHSDNKGNSQDNEKLSRQRAKTVRSFLIEKGFPADRFSVVGFGETRPIADNSTPEGRKKNRRVEFKVIKEE